MKIAVVFDDKCHPDRCNLECMAYCPPMRTGTEVIWLSEETGRAVISEETCIACGICLPAGVPISTESGIVPIERVSRGTRVLTHKGRYQPVAGLHSRNYTGPLYRITSTGQPDPLEMTEDHPVLAVVRPWIKGGKRLLKGPGTLRWLRPEELKVGDYLAKPRFREPPRNFTWETSIPAVLRGGRNPVWGLQIVSLPVVPELARLVGYYLAEGSVGQRRTAFSFHELEQEYIEDVRRITQRFFGVRGRVKQNTGHGQVVRFGSVVLTRVFAALGTSSDTKRIPFEFVTGPEEVRAELIKGLWRGDGYRDPLRSYFTITTTSPHIAYQAQEILASLGIVASTYSFTSPGKKRAYYVNIRAEYVERMADLLGLPFEEKRNRTASHSPMDDEYVYVPIRKIQVEQVTNLPVYNLEVSEDETYVAAGQVVHNCIAKCPFDAIRIVNLPDELGEEMVHRYGRNRFRLFRLPVPKAGHVIGLLGPNGIGKTTAINILSGQLIPNLGGYEEEGDWDRALEAYAGTEMQNYLRPLADGTRRTALKPQYVDRLPAVQKGEVGPLLEGVDERGELDGVVRDLELEGFLHSPLKTLSGGELQRTAIAATLLKDADAYFFDEPSSYLDIHQRLKVARVIHDLSRRKPVVVVEHDLAILDFLAETVYLLYGEKGTYGIVAQPRPVRSAINVYLEGYLPAENVRFRKREIRFEARAPRPEWKAETLLTFSPLEVELNGFSLEAEGGVVRKGEVVGVLGPNATGKTTFVRVLAGELRPKTGGVEGEATVSYKPQYIQLAYEGSARELLLGRIGKQVETSYFRTEVAAPLELEPIYEKEVTSLSGGEQQRVAIALALGAEADIYLMDEPSAYLDSNQRMEAARGIRRAMENTGKTALIVDHDVYFIDMVADSLMVFTGVPGQAGRGTGPYPMRDGMNRFLREVDVSFRRDRDTQRPRINNPDSKLDRQQKAAGEFYYQVA